MIEGCCSAASPCNFQKEFPNRLCDHCEVVRLQACVKDIDAAITAYAQSIGSRASLAIQQYEPAWANWKRLCDTLAAANNQQKVDDK